MHARFWSKNLNGREHLEDIREDVIRMDLRETAWEVVDWMHLAQDSDQWWNLLNTVMNLWSSQKAGNFLSSQVTIHNFCRILMSLLCFVFLSV
jgi:hypothetical protein